MAHALQYPFAKTLKQGGEMKRTVILLAGLGLILLVGVRENSLAQNGNSISLVNAQSTDSSTVPSLQERAESNFKYVKADPVGPGKVAGELLAGSIGAVVGGSICAGIGFGLGSMGSSEGSCDGFFCFDEGGIIGALVGYAVGSTFGAATGVHLVGSSDEETGSFWAAFGGSLLGILGSGLLSSAIVKDFGNDGPSWATFSLVTGSQAGGATLCFNSTRKKKVEVFSDAMFNLKNGQLALAMPQVNISSDSFKSGVYKVNIFEANF
jgi:hypothetical protein